MEILRDRYDKLFTNVINLLQDGSLTHTEMREFIEIMESTQAFASSAIRKAIQKSNMALREKANLKES